jgi:exodeoxyribonuclease V gamma subunit
VLLLHRSHHAAALAEALAGVLAVPQADPFARDVVGVPTRGVERWLTQTLAARLGARPGRADGILAAVEFPTPRQLVDAALVATGGRARRGDPWSADRLRWPLLEVVDAHLDAPWLAILARHLRATGETSAPARAGTPAAAGAAPPHRRLLAVQHLARLFDRYALHRPAMLRAWAAGNDVDAEGEPLPEAVAWQAPLWRALRERLGVPSPAERLPEVLAALRDDPTLVDLPPRLSLFGLTRLPAAQVAVLRALAVHRDVHLLLLHPSPALWDAVAGRLAETGGTTGPVSALDDGRATAAIGDTGLIRRDDPTATLPAHPLLASWGRDVRELQLVATPADGDALHGSAPQGASRTDSGSSPPDVPTAPGGAPHAQPPTLLRRLQAAIHADEAPPGVPIGHAPDARPVLDPGDRSIEVHACHGRARQVEVLRDALLHRLAADPTLEPRDIVVLCPDIEAFAPLVKATFDAGPATGSADDGAEADGLPRLRVRLADRAVRQTNPLLGTIERLLELGDERLTASQVLDLADRGPVRRRFGFDDDALSRIEGWIRESEVRWGLDRPHRARFGLGSIDVATWRRGLDRLLSGVALTEDARTLVGGPGGALPVDDVGSTDIDLAGRLAELLDRLEAIVEDLARPQTIAGWTRTIADAADALCATSDDDAWQRAELDLLLDDRVQEAASDPLPGDSAGVSDAVGPASSARHARDGSSAPTARTVTSDASPGGHDALLTLAEVRALIAEHLQGRPTRASFRTGHLTFCTLQPMRSVPHRVICLLGLDDTAFPREAPRDGDDLVRATPHVGDHDGRSEDRQMLLDALMAADDALIVTYTGRDERTNVVRPPAVPVGELLDAIDATVRPADDDDGGPAPAAPRLLARAREQLVVDHPLQSFDPRNFQRGVDGRPPLGFDRIALEGAQSLAGLRAGRHRLVGIGGSGDDRGLDEPLPAVPEPVIALDDLVRFFEHPSRAFLRQRLGVVLPREDEEESDELPTELDGLGGWAVGERLLQGVRSGTPGHLALEAERARGALPPAELGEHALTRIQKEAQTLSGWANELLGPPGPRSSLDVRVELPGGRRIGGTVAGLDGDVLQAVSYSRVAPKHRLAAWVRLLALTASHPDRELRAITLGRSRRGAPRRATATIARIPVLGVDPEERRAAALAALAVLVDLRDRGLREPPPLYCQTSAAYAAAAVEGLDPAVEAKPVWESGWGRFGRIEREDADREHQRLLRGTVPFGTVAAAAARADESGDGWDERHPSRLGRWALRTWSGLLAVEELEDA